MIQLFTTSTDAKTFRQQFFLGAKSLIGRGSVVVIVVAAICLQGGVVYGQSEQFNKDRAFGFLKQQVDFGPRLPDSGGTSLTRELIRKELTENGFRVEAQDFTARSAILGRTVSGQNLIGYYPADAPAKYAVSAHYDTRPFAEMDPDPAKRTHPVPGANDGGSGTAILLEYARLIPQKTLPHGVALLFFDLEDHGTSQSGTFCQGSHYMASHLPEGLRQLEAGINLDMVGDKDLVIVPEQFGITKAPDLTKRFWDHATPRASVVFQRTRSIQVYDDHLPFLQRDIPYINIIDMEYPSWHTTRDLPEMCSPQSLETVGVIVLDFISN